ncbi:hypothetical protein Sjap_023296 [Stephania japonica]|uniref:Threonylcarbamoyl-AMP synthase n=1 Tax=Stephania japonica TaxID=461633 RepID=A0AAP0HKB9_9MAGN
MDDARVRHLTPGLGTDLRIANHTDKSTLGHCRAPYRRIYLSPQFLGNEKLECVQIRPKSSDELREHIPIELHFNGVTPTGVFTVYVRLKISCSLGSHFSITRLRSCLDKLETINIPLSILCHSFHDIDAYTMGFPRGNGQGMTNIFRVVKHCLPGPYTFILPASKALPKQCIRYGTATAKYASRKKDVGVRMPADVICQAILEKMGSPLISTSVKWPKEDGWMIDPVVIADVYGPEGLDFVVDGGLRVAHPSTVVDMTHHPPTIIRQGKGPKLDWMVAKDDKDSAKSIEELRVSSSRIF